MAWLPRSNAEPGLQVSQGFRMLSSRVQQRASRRWAAHAHNAASICASSREEIQGSISQPSWVQDAPKPTTKAERRAVQERQRAEKKAAKVRAEHDPLASVLIAI